MHLHYLCQPSPAIALARIQDRVKKGGYNVPADDVRRRFSRSLAHLAHDTRLWRIKWAIWNNQTSPPTLMAESATCSITELGRILLLS